PRSSKSFRPPPPPWREASPTDPPTAATSARRIDSKPPPPSSRRREVETMIPPVQKSEEDLIEPLLERLEDLKLIANRSEGARYVLELALTVAPARVGLVHLYEPGTSEFCAE